MKKTIRILGDGQIWDVQGIDPCRPDKIFEDLFSGRALGELASNIKIFRKFSDKRNKITGISVTKALISKNKRAGEEAKGLLKNFAMNASKGIGLLTTGKAIKKTWTKKEKDYWRGLKGVIIGGGVSEGRTGKIIVDEIRKDLSQNGFSNIKIFQAQFTGKDSGFLGAVAFILDRVKNEAQKLKKEKVVSLGIDIGRDEIGIGAIVLDARAGKVIYVKRRPWIFSYIVDTPFKDKLCIFKDSDRHYKKEEKKLGFKIRSSIINTLVELIIRAYKKTHSLGYYCSKIVGIGLPGEANKDGYIVGSTHYLPFLRKQDGFHFSKAVEKRLSQSVHKKFKICIVNDGIAAGLANLRFAIGLDRLKIGKYAFLGPGSGLGGFIGEVIYEN